jgi:hypothetical protein
MDATNEKSDEKSDQKRTGAAHRARIVRVGAVARDSLDIDLSNGSILLLSIELILSLPGFGILAKDDRIYYPKTDGDSIYWPDGPRCLSVEEILQLAGQS